MRWLLLLAACSSPHEVPSVDAAVTVAAGTCGTLTTVPSEPGVHVAVGTPITWSTNPPSTGMHYGVWASYEKQYASLDRGYYVHNAEHGSIVFLYNCTDCDDTIAALETVAKNMAVDHSCTLPIRARTLVVHDPLLPALIGAVAWDQSYSATCVDSDYLAQFAADHYNMGPEDLCSDGASLGGVAF